MKSNIFKGESRDSIVNDIQLQFVCDVVVIKSILSDLVVSVSV